MPGCATNAFSFPSGQLRLGSGHMSALPLESAHPIPPKFAKKVRLEVGSMIEAPPGYPRCVSLRARQFYDE